jgi:hypothetical protein
MGDQTYHQSKTVAQSKRSAPQETTCQPSVPAGGMYDNDQVDK